MKELLQKVTKVTKGLVILSLLTAVAPARGELTNVVRAFGGYPETNQVFGTNMVLLSRYGGSNAAVMLASLDTIAATIGGGAGGGASNALVRFNGNTNAGTWLEIGSAGLVPNITTNGHGANSTNFINLPTADNVHSGILSSNDWQNFTGKQASNAVLARLISTHAITNVSPTFGVLASDILYAPANMALTNVSATGNVTVDGTLSVAQAFTPGGGIFMATGAVNRILVAGADGEVTPLAAGAGLEFSASTVNTVITNGNTLFLGVNGNDSTAVRGRADKPWRTFTNAVAAMQNGDALRVLPGQYTNTLVYSNTYGHAVRLIGKTNILIEGSGWGTEAWGLGAGSHFLITNCAGVKVRNFAVRGNKPAGSVGTWLANGLVAGFDVVNSRGVLFEGMLLRDLPNHGISCIDDVSCPPPRDVTVRFNWFENGGATSGVPFLVKDGPAINVTGDNWHVTDNVITNWARGVEIYSDVQDLRGLVVSRNKMLWMPWQGICPIFNFKMIGAVITDNYIEGENGQPLAGVTGGIVLTGTGAEFCQISGNVIRRFQQGQGIAMEAVGGGLTFRGNRIAGNVVEGCYSGIVVAGNAHDTNVCANVISGNVLRGIGNSGISIDGVDQLVTGNVISHFGTNSGSGRGIFSLAAPFGGTNRAIVIARNVISDGPVGIEVVAANALTNRLDENQINRCTTAITDAGTGTIKGSAGTVRLGTAGGMDAYGLPPGNTTTQKVDVVKNSGAVVSSRNQLNFIEGSGTTLTIADDAGNGQTDITIASSGGGGVASNAVANIHGFGTNETWYGAIVVPQSAPTAVGGVVIFDFTNSMNIFYTMNSNVTAVVSNLPINGVGRIVITNTGSHVMTWTGPNSNNWAGQFIPAVPPNRWCIVDVSRDKTDGLMTNYVMRGSEFPAELGFAVSDETTAITAGAAKFTFHMPYTMTVTEVFVELNTVSSSGAVTVDIKEAGTTIFSTKPTIDQSEEDTSTAATPSVMSDTSLAKYAKMTVNIDGAGTGAKGLKIWMRGTKQP